MKKNFLLLVFITILLMFISTAYAAFNSELTITGDALIKKDTIPPTCGSWYLRDSNLTIQEAYNQNKFKNPGTNTTWTNEDQKLFIECIDNMSGNYGCINVTEITDTNNNKRYYKEVKDYTTSIQTDPNVVTVTLKDAYQNETICTLPVGGSNPYLDKTGPTVTITPTAYNKFTYSAVDDIGVLGYMVTTTPVEPAIDDVNWVATPTEVTIDNSEAKTYYVWSKDGINISHETISTYLLTKTEGVGTTLSIKYQNNNGTELSTGYVLDETNIYISATLINGYSDLSVKVNNVAIQNPSTYAIETTTTISSSAILNSYIISFNANGGSGGQSSNVTATYGSPMPAISTTVPTRTGYTFMGWYDNSNYLASDAKQYYTNAGASARSFDKNSDTILYAGWKINNYTISVTKGSNITSVSGGGTYNYGTTVTLYCTKSANSTWSTYEYTNGENYGSIKYNRTYTYSAPSGWTAYSGNTYKKEVTVTGNATYSCSSTETQGRTNCYKRDSNIKSFSYTGFKGCFSTGSGSGCNLDSSNWKTNGSYCTWTGYTGNGPEIPVFDSSGNRNAVFFRVNVTGGYASAFVWSNDPLLLAYAYYFNYSYTLYDNSTGSSSSSASGRLNGSGSSNSIANAFFSSLRWVGPGSNYCN